LRTCGATSCIWRRAASACRPSIRRYRRFGSFKVTLKRHDIVEHTHFIHESRKLPVVLSIEEVARLLDAAPGLKYKAALSVAYGAGLRATEVVSLKVSEQRGVQRVL
jgi:site-specific recombinase XerD